MKIVTLTSAEVRARHVAQWGEAKVAANEADVARRFSHLRHSEHVDPDPNCRRCQRAQARHSQ